MLGGAALPALGSAHSLPSLVILVSSSQKAGSQHPLYLWGATHVAPQSSLSTVLKMRVCGGGRGGGGEFWSPGEIKLSFSVDIRVIRSSINPPTWKWMYDVLTLFLVFLVEEKGG